MSDVLRAMGSLAGLASPHPALVGLVVTLAFAGLARLVRGVSVSGALAGAAICFVLYISAGPGTFVALVSVFVLAWVSTRLGYQRKRKLGTAERRDGRTALQVLANLGIAAICCAFAAMTSRTAAFLLASSAALSEAAADTVSSELGQARSVTARLITTGETVPAGTNGGVSWLGSVAGVSAATLVSLVCMLTGLIPMTRVGISIAAAVVGMIADSYLGALFERQRLLNNDAVNFLGTLIAATTAFLLN